MTHDADQVAPAIGVLTAGNSRAPENFGGTPHRLTLALREAGAMAAGVDLETSGWHRLRWHACQVAMARPPAGWQYSPSALRLRGRRLKEQGFAEGFFVSLFQVPPDATLGREVFYIDGTLSQLFDTYEELSRLSFRQRERALKLEKLHYMQSRGIIVKTRAAKESLLGEYGIHPSKIDIVPPVPNLSERSMVQPDSRDLRRLGSLENPIRFLSVGKDFIRKGIDLAHDFVSSVRSSGYNATLDVVGMTMDDAPPQVRSPWVNFHGFLGKGQGETGFEEVASNCHIGLLFSRAELAGLALAEYQYLGLIAFGSGVGGMPDVAFTDTVRFADSEAGRKLLSDTVVEHLRRQSIGGMLDLAWRQRSRVPTWRNVASSVLENLS